MEENNHLLKLLIALPNVGWDWKSLSYNPCITMDIIKSMPDKPWVKSYFSKNHSIKLYELNRLNLYDVSGHPYLTFDIVRKNLNGFYDMFFLSKNPIITEDFLLKNDLRWDFYGLVCNPNISIDVLVLYANPDDYNHWFHIMESKKFTIDIVKKYPIKYWDFCIISMNKNITYQTILDNLVYNWDWKKFCKNPSLTLEFVKSHPEIKWDYEGFSSNPNITYEFIEENQMLQFCWKSLYKNENIKWKKLFCPRNNDYYYLSFNPHLDFEIVDLNKPWDWDLISYNVTIDIIKKNPEMPWDYVSLSRNKNLTAEFVLENLDKNWDWNLISYNRFNSDELVKIRRFRENRAAKIIQRVWIRWDCNPNNPRMQKRFFDWHQILKNSL